jgi:hypothetical protein
VSIFRGDASEVYALAGDLSKIGARTVPALRGVMAEAGKGLADDWRRNAVETSGEHGKHYPASIDSELVFDFGGVSVDVGPNSSRPQGRMGRGFEFGSQNQPPHLDGLRALDGFQMRAERMVDAAVGHLFDV